MTINVSDISNYFLHHTQIIHWYKVIQIFSLPLKYAHQGLLSSKQDRDLRLYIFS